MTEEQEKQWLSGNRAAYRDILLKCAGQLGDDDPLRSAAAMIAERHDAIRALRGLCERCEIPNDWPDDLHLADIIEKYIERYWPEEEKEHDLDN
jgi:hypothetical protein